MHGLFNQQPNDEENTAQASEQPVSVQPVAEKYDKFDEVKNYKDLLDQGIITQEEFDAKKKELLEL
jgi:hypothetical protein